MNPKYIPNLLSVLRILLVPLFAILFLFEYPKYISAAIAVFILAGITDVVDGFLARKFCWITNIGKVLDPFADKLMQCMVLACTFYKGLVPLWLLAFVVVKELFLITGSIFLFKNKHIVVKSSWYGKVATVIFYLYAVIIMCFEKYMTFGIVILCSVVTLLFMIFAAVMYTWEYMKKKWIFEKTENIKKPESSTKTNI